MAIQLEKPKTFKDIVKAFVPTILILVNTLVLNIIIPYLQGKETTLTIWSVGAVLVGALINALKQDDNPWRFWDSTLLGTLVTACLDWLLVSLNTHLFDFKMLLIVALPILLGGLSRGLGKGQQAPEGGT